MNSFLFFVMLQTTAASISTTLEYSHQANLQPNGCDKRSARNWGVRRVSEQQQEEILDQLTHRAIIEHEDNVLGRGCIGRRG
jgi:hypothetical protein